MLKNLKAMQKEKIMGDDKPKSGLAARLTGKSGDAKKPAKGKLFGSMLMGKK